MDRRLQRTVNQVKHLSHSARHVYDRVTALCPPAYQYGSTLAAEDDYGVAWQRVHELAFELDDALEDLAMLSDVMLSESAE